MDGTGRTVLPRQRFRCTRHFLTNFLKRNRISYRCTRPSRRPVIDPEEVKVFREQLTAAYESTRWDHILNADESFWLVLYLPRKTLGPTGVETVEVEVDGDPKAGLTLMGTITAAGTKLPLFLVAKGRTNRCHKQFKSPTLDQTPVYIANSKSGWVTQPVFLEYLRFLRKQIPAGRLVLVVDQYPTHLTPASQQLASRLNIDFIKVPKGATGQYQPLDRGIYGAMKSSAHAKWTRLFAKSDIPRATKALAAELALQCWDGIDEDIILSAWNINGPEDDFEDDDQPLNNDDDDFMDVEFGHDDLDEEDIDFLENISEDDDHDDDE